MVLDKKVFTIRELTENNFKPSGHIQTTCPHCITNNEYITPYVFDEYVDRL